MNKIKRKGYSVKLICILIIFMASLVTYSGLSAPKKGQNNNERKVEVNSEIEGEVSAIRDGFIAIVYRRDSEEGVDYELALPIADNVTIGHKKRLEQIQVGDLVQVKYREVKEVSEDSEQSRVDSRIAVKITFLRSNSKGMLRSDKSF